MFDWVKDELLSAIRVNLDKDGKRMDNIIHKGNSNAGFTDRAWSIRYRNGVA